MAVLRTMYMMLRQSSSHVFNIEQWLRKSFPINSLEMLTEDLLRSGGKTTLLNQLSAACPELMKDFRAGFSRLRILNRPELTGFVDIAVLLQYVANEKRVNWTICPLCEENPPAQPVHSDLVSFELLAPSHWDISNTGLSVVTYIVPSAWRKKDVLVIGE
jgi:hypothetical protein